MSLYQHGFEGNSDQNDNQNNGNPYSNNSQENQNGTYSSTSQDTTNQSTQGTSQNAYGTQSNYGTTGSYSSNQSSTGTTGSYGANQNGYGTSGYGTQGSYSSSQSSYGSSQSQYGTGSNYTGYNGGYNSGNTGSSYQPRKPKKNKNENSVGKKIAVAAAVALVFGVVGGAAFTGTNYLTSKALGTSSVTESSDGSSLTRSSTTLDSTAVSTATTVTDVSDIVENVMPSIVQVTNISVEEYRSYFGTYTQPTESAGSGIIISQDSDYLYIATNNHVVEGATTLTITFCDDNAVTAEVQGTDESTDLAVVKVRLSDISSETLSAIKVATIGSSDNLAVGSSAVVIGNALGYGQSVTTGVISALDREVSIETSSGTTITNLLIQTDAAVNPGNSGGALLNMNGEVIGIVSAKYSDTSVEGMGYAIPISSASDIIESLINGEEVTHDNEAVSETESGAYLGIYGMDINSQSASAYGLPVGVYVTQAIEGEAAANAGIEKGDVITSINGTAISSMTDIKEVLSTLNPGDTIQVTFADASRSYDEATTTVTLGDRSEAEVQQ